MRGGLTGRIVGAGAVLAAAGASGFPAKRFSPQALAARVRSPLGG